MWFTNKIKIHVEIKNKRHNSQFFIFGSIVNNVFKEGY